MLVGDAQEVARHWVEREAGSLPGFYGAYLAGSMSSMPADAVLPGESDVDIKILVDDPVVTTDPQKFVYCDVILDVSYGSRESVSSPEAVLGSYYTAVHFAHSSILSDPTGRLSDIQAIVAHEYSRRMWVRIRCEQARETLEACLAGQALGGAMHGAVFNWLLATFFVPPMVLVADLRNPTHRRGMANLGQVLTRYGHSGVHERVLKTVGSTSMSRAEVEELLRACAKAFDAAVVVRETPFLMASNISHFARPIAIGGAQELIDHGFHREAMPWIAFIQNLCHTVLQNDAPEDMQARFEPDYKRLLTALGVPTSADLAARQEMIGQLMPDLWSATEDIIQKNPTILD